MRRVFRILSNKLDRKLNHLRRARTILRVMYQVRVRMRSIFALDYGSDSIYVYSRSQLITAFQCFACQVEMLGGPGNEAMFIDVTFKVSIN